MVCSSGGSHNNYGALTSAFKALHDILVPYISGMISHHPLTPALFQPDTCLFPSPCFALVSSAISAMPTEPHPYVC